MEKGGVIIGIKFFIIFLKAINTNCMMARHKKSGSVGLLETQLLLYLYSTPTVPPPIIFKILVGIENGEDPDQTV